MMNTFFAKYFFTLIGQAHACPMCMGSNPNDKYFFYVIIAFILFATGVILFVLKTCLKYKNINNKVLEDKEVV